MKVASALLVFFLLATYGNAFQEEQLADRDIISQEGGFNYEFNYEEGSCNQYDFKGAPSKRTYTIPIMPQVPPPISLKGTKMIDKNGNVMPLLGANWWGFEGGGLWMAGLDKVDFATEFYRYRSLGFNAVRLPFLFNELAKSNVWRVQHKVCATQNPTDMRNSLLDPLVKTSTPLPQYTGCPYLPNGSNACNSYIPFDTMWNRYFWTLQYMIGQGAYVVIDFHPTKFYASSPDTRLHKDLTRFANSWQGFWRDLMSLPTYNTSIKGRVLVDIHNEPDAFNVGWNEWTNIAMAGASAIWKLEPSVPILVEGTNQSWTGNSCWGDGFQAQPDFNKLYSWCASNRKCSSASVFFSRVKSQWPNAPWILSPHLYNAVSNIDKGDKLWTALQKSWGNKSCSSCPFPQDGGVVHKPFPIMVGEIGYISDSQDIPADLPGGSNSTRDGPWLRDASLFLRSMTPRYPHDTFAGIFWWAWNSVLTIGNDRVGAINWSVIRYFVQFGMRPWYLAPIPS
jgi:hypothetical protein